MNTTPLRPLRAALFGFALLAALGLSLARAGRRPHGLVPLTRSTLGPTLGPTLGQDEAQDEPHLQYDAEGRPVRGMIIDWPPPFPVAGLVRGGDDDGDEGEEGEGIWRDRYTYFIVEEGEEDEARAALERAHVPLERVRFLSAFGAPWPGESEPPPGPARIVAEWEPALGALVSWPLDVPDALLVEIARDDVLFLLVKPDDADAARAHVSRLGIDQRHVEYVPSDVDSAYPRDFGPHQIFDGAGELAVLDTMFAGWPQYPAGAAEGMDWFMIWFDGPGDDSVPLDVADYFELPTYSIPAYMTGGNFLVDGLGTAFCTRAQLDENLENHTVADADEYAELVRAFGGVEDLVMLENTEARGIQHIDCWMKVLDGQRLLVKRPPEGHPEAEHIDRNLERIAELRTAGGGRWQVLRIDCPSIEGRSWTGEEPLAAYTNSLILNRKVLVPMFGIPGDEDALETWRAALPGYEVIGFEHRDWRHFDALHCRTRAVFDPYMLRMVHVPMPEQVEHSDGGYAIGVTIDDRSEAGLVEEELLLFHRAVGDAEWRTVPLVHDGGDSYRARIPFYPPGAEVEYYLQAADFSGRTETLPRSAPAGSYRFTIGG